MSETREEIECVAYEAFCEGVKWATEGIDWSEATVKGWWESTASKDAANVAASAARVAVINECVASIHGEYPYNDIDRDPNAGPPPSKDFRDGWNTLRLKILKRLKALPIQPLKGE